MRFARIEFAWWLFGGVALLALLRLWMRKPFAASTTVRWLSKPSYRASLIRRLPVAVLFAALVLTLLALLDPLQRRPETVVQSHGRDIVMVLDMSDSMQTPMLTNGAVTTRLDAVKAAMKMFVNSRRDDRMALILFSENAYIVCPLTFDHQYLLQYIDSVDKNAIEGEGRTAIGDALKAASQLLAQQSTGAGKRNQVVMLFTDGESNTGSDPVPQVAALSDQDIRVNVVGIDLADVTNKVAVEDFVNAVKGHDGRYFDANTPSDVDDASHAIDKLEIGLLTNKVYAREYPVYEWFALPALLCLVAAITLRAVPYFVDQS